MAQAHAATARPCEHPSGGQTWRHESAQSAVAAVSIEQVRRIAREAGIAGGPRWLSRRGGRKRAMAGHKIGTREEWLAAREELLKREKEYTRLGDGIAQLRRDLPWVRVEKDYRLEADDGEK